MALHWTRCMNGACFTKVYEDQPRCPRCFNPVQQIGRPLALIPVEPCDLSGFGLALCIVGLAADGMVQQRKYFEADEELSRAEADRDMYKRQRDRWEQLHADTCGRIEALAKGAA